jgi:hypothetical protein
MPHVISAYLEDIAAKAFDTHPGELEAVLGSQGGIYALYTRRQGLYYVGLATNLFARIKHHRRDKHAGKWTRFSAYATRLDGHTREMESLTLSIAKPPGNRQGGRLRGSKNLKREFEQGMRRASSLLHAEISGGRAAAGRRKRAARGSRGADALSVLSGHRRKLWGERNGVSYEATLLQSGQIRYAGALYDSPAAAARAATGRVTNGWRFWYYPLSRGEWIQLYNLKS